MQADFDSGKVLRKGKSWWEQLGATNETYKRLNKNIEEISSSPYLVAQSNRVGLLTSNLHAPKFLYQSHLECRYLDIKNRRTSPSLFPNDSLSSHLCLLSKMPLLRAQRFVQAKTTCDSQSCSRGHENVLDHARNKLCKSRGKKLWTNPLCSGGGEESCLST